MCPATVPQQREVIFYLASIQPYLNTQVSQIHPQYDTIYFRDATPGWIWSMKSFKGEELALKIIAILFQVLYYTTSLCYRPFYAVVKRQ